MSDDQPTTGQTNADLSVMVSENKALNAKLSEATQTIEQLRTELGQVKESSTGLQSANSQANERLAAIQQQFEDAQKKLEQYQGQAANLQTQLEQVRGEAGQINQQLSTNQQQLSLYKMIGSDPKYHSLVGAIDSIKVGANEEEQKKILDGLVGTVQQQQKAAIQSIQTGATPTSGAAPQQPVQPGQPDLQAITDAKQLYGMLQTVPFKSERYKAISQRMDQLLLEPAKNNTPN